MIINNGVAQRDAGYIIKIGLVMLLTTVLMAAGGILGAYFSTKASIKLYQRSEKGCIFQGPAVLL